MCKHRLRGPVHVIGFLAETSQDRQTTWHATGRRQAQAEQHACWCPSPAARVAPGASYQVVHPLPASPSSGRAGLRRAAAHRRGNWGSWKAGGLSGACGLLSAHAVQRCVWAAVQQARAVQWRVWAVVQQASPQAHAAQHSGLVEHGSMRMLARWEAWLINQGIVVVLTDKRHCMMKAAGTTAQAQSGPAKDCVQMATLCWQWH